MATWRVGRKLGRTLYKDDACVGIVDTPELAAEIVKAMASLSEPALDALGTTAMSTCGRCGLPVSSGICAPEPRVFHDKPEDCIPDLRRALDAYGAAYKLWADAMYARGDKPDPWRFTDFVRENVRDAMTKTAR